MWKGFKLLDKRLASVQLPHQVNELAQRAQASLGENKARLRDARPLMFWLWVIGHPSAAKLMKFDPVAQIAVNKVKQEVANREARASTQAARVRKRRERALRRNRVTA